MKERHGSAEKIAASGPARFWNDPADLESRDLFYGPGGSEHAPAPQGTFTFVKEDLDGTNPKFVVKDQDGVKWKVKLGEEARPETVASRLVWAAGYYTNEDYFMPALKVSGMPARLHRGQDMVGPDGTVPNVRLKRENAGEKKLGAWEWRQNPFTGTRELDGLRVMMALINNWDLKDENNAIYHWKGEKHGEARGEDRGEARSEKSGDGGGEAGGERIYMVSDLGASFGSPGRSWSRAKSKGDLDSYTHSKFILKFTPTTVDFDVPARPRFIYASNPKEYKSRIGLEWIGKNIPRQNVQWMGKLLARLSPKQIRDAFRAAGYSPQEIEGFATIVEQRIAALNAL